MTSRLDQLKAAQEARTPGPWIHRTDTDDQFEYSGWVDPHGAYSSEKADNVFMALAANMMPDLLALVEAAENLRCCAEVDDARERWEAFDTALARLRAPQETRKETT